MQLKSHTRQIGNKRMQACLVTLQGDLRLVVFAAQASLAQAMFDGGCQKVQVVLENISSRTCQYGLNDGCFAPVMGKEQKG